MGCQWSSFNTLSTENPLSHSFLGFGEIPFPIIGPHSLLGLGEFPFPIIGPLGNKNWPPSMKVEKLENFHNKSGLVGCKWSSLNVPGTGNPPSHPFLGVEEFPFKIISLLGY